MALFKGFEVRDWNPSNGAALASVAAKRGWSAVIPASAYYDAGRGVIWVDAFGLLLLGVEI